ncbi:Choline dehydrogenase [Ceratobasidium theobromae]|uniref:Choline dehydrogenase n=1 Tax=Ceratobasidium theobromae TaxID=1582974 RepID=A0A5N5QIL6_9AGAM|nr:Choline dehydrogenase [Ceratobasidium theobromae]
MKATTALPLLACIGTSTAAVTRARPRSLSNSGNDFASQAYDYVIIGGGTAGLTIAARLSEDPNVSVGVIEAGSYLAEDAMINTPMVAAQLQGNAKYDWMFKTAPQVHSNNRAVNLPRGKVLGGSSAINMMVFDRASKVEYDAWSSLGNSGWDWDGLLPYMKSAEHFTSVDPFRVNDTHASPDDIFPSQGTKGPVAPSYNTWYSDVATQFGDTLSKLGIPFNYNPDSGNAFGTFNTARSVNSTTGRRSYAGTTYYAYNAHRPNFVVLTEAQATKINFKNSTAGGKATASGVSFVHNSTTFTVQAKKEVILSAGTFQTPHILELSGIGNSTILRKFGITPVVNLPSVGENYQDHILVPTTYELKPGHTTLDILRNNATYAAEAQAQYATTHDGIYSSSPALLSFFGLDSIASKAKLANMTAQLDREIALDSLTPLRKAQYSIQKDWFKKKVGQIEMIYYQGYFGAAAKPNTSYVSLIVAIQHPFSQGSIHIESADPLASPLIDPNYFSKSFDLDMLIESVRFALNVSKTEPLASAVVGRQDPAPEVVSDADIAEYIKASFGTVSHPIGTAALAPKELGGVVDTNLKVYGTSNVRVADASIIPIHISTHLQRTVYGIGEKASAIIKKSS